MKNEEPKNKFERWINSHAASFMIPPATKLMFLKCFLYAYELGKLDATL